MGGEVWRTPFLVSDIPVQAIVGSDFLRDHQILVDLAGTRILWWTMKEGEKPPTEKC